MFKLMMVPVDLKHAESLSKALEVAASIAKSQGVPVCYAGVTGSAPDELASNPAEYEKKLQLFSDEQAANHGISASCKAFIGHDLTTDVDDVLLDAVTDTGADLVVMATHSPTATDHFWPSNGGKIATHSAASVFLVRP